MASARQEDEGWLENAIEARISAKARTARAFVSASQHSARVRRLRWLLLIGSLAAIATVVGGFVLKTVFVDATGLSAANLFVEGSKVTMDKPRLTGARADGSGYVITADRAIQDIAHPTEVDLVEMRGDIGGGRADGTGMKMSSHRGHYNTVKNTLELAGDVRLKNPQYQIELKTAHVDFKLGVYETQDPILVTTASGTTITADSATSSDNASLLTFVGHVKTQIPPQQDKAQIASEMKGNEP